MRPVRIIATAAVVAALAVTGCSSRTANRTAASASSTPSSVSTTQPTAASTTRSTAGTVGDHDHYSGHSGQRQLRPLADQGTGRGSGHPCLPRLRALRRSRHQLWSHGAGQDKATAGGQATASFAVPGGFAGSTIPGRKDTFQAKGRQSGRAASATFTVASPAKAACALAPARGLAGSQVTLSCRGFAGSERVDVTFEAEVLATAKATAGGQVAASFAVPSGFAGSHYPGRKDTFQAKGRQSGTVASATFTVTG